MSSRGVAGMGGMRKRGASYIAVSSPADQSRVTSRPIPLTDWYMFRSSKRSGFCATRVVPVLVSIVASGVVQTISAHSAHAQAAGVRRYRLDSKTQQTINADAIGGGSQQTQTDRSAYLRITVTDSAGGKALSVVIDSLLNRGDNLPPGTAAVADSARGKVFTGFVAADGTVSPISHPAGAGALGTAIGGQLDEFFPRAKAGAKEGDNWTVTSERPQLVPGGQLSVKRTTAYAAMGAAPRDGVTAQRLDMTFTTAATGAMRIGPANATVDGTSMGSGSAFITAAGIYLGGMRTEKTERRLVLDGAPGPVLVSAETATTIALLK